MRTTFDEMNNALASATWRSSWTGGNVVDPDAAAQHQEEQMLYPMLIGRWQRRRDGARAVQNLPAVSPRERARDRGGRAGLEPPEPLERVLRRWKNCSRTAAAVFDPPPALSLYDILRRYHYRYETTESADGDFEILIWLP